MYTWSNEKRLDTLRATGEKSRLVFETDGEKAEVSIDEDNTITKVVFTDSKGVTVEITPSSAKRVEVGEESWARDVYHYLVPGGPAPSMRLGITKHRGAGTWSSLPHDFELNTEEGFEEVFFHMLDGGLKGETPRAWQRGRGVWFDNSAVDDMWPVENRTFSTIPMGYHPVVGEPGVTVSYIWVYLAKNKHWEKI